ncbi:hypothetical protein [Roseimicrobium sp. ORNL1]|uniref:hypothetical protein n=1 Tax=Roseimicrobium sp. ORNL1 TaxID=2711231 RepID=UPI00197CC886|nr:hypothetical protein [Roseimicrobium sp. ORNL1]
MHRIALFLLLLTSPLLSAEPWPGVAYTEIRAYAWPKEKSPRAVILEGMKLGPGVINEEGAVLTPEQSKKLIAAVTGKHPKYPVAACHIPRNAFVFYDAAKKPVAYVEICFKCFNHRISPEDSSGYIDLVALASIFEAHKLPMGEHKTAAHFKESFDAINRMLHEPEAR